MVSRAFLSLLFITILVVGTKPSNLESWELISSFTGILVVGANFNCCRVCLIQTAGVDRIALIKNDNNVFHYLIKGRITMLESFLRQCNNMNSCIIQIEMKLWPTSSPKLAIFEYGNNWFSMQIDSAVYKSSHTTINRKNLPSVQLYERYDFFFARKS